MHLFATLALVVKFVFGQAENDSLYNISFNTINGTTKSMSDFSGKKVLIVVLPMSANGIDTTYINKIDSFSRQYTSLTIVAVPSREDGFNLSYKDQLQEYYTSLPGTQFVLSAGMYTHKSSGPLQHDLFSWLTHEKRNIHFDIDVKASKQMFFINEQGELYGVFSPETILSDKFIRRLIQ